ncbi:Glycerophosphocholine phosphodiesterase [Cadophora gregata f. sp. sojae]|nr:Glycerophosphocholine phosphodiesterase [Cadophora gregata f. sp. sojae]
MRFGRNLHQRRIPEWTSFYLNYNQLKQEIKSIFIKAAEHKHGLDFTNFWNPLHTAILNVESFYMARLTDIETRSVLLFKQLTSTSTVLQLTALNDADTGTSRSLLAACLQLRLDLKRLLWYGKVNRHGFICLLRKLQGTPNIRVPSNVELSQYEFVSQCRTWRKIESIEESILTLRKWAYASDYTALAPSLSLVGALGLATQSTLSQDLGMFLERPIAQDDVSGLQEVVRKASLATSKMHLSSPHMQLLLLDLAIMYGSKKCMLDLLSQFDLKKNDGFQSQDNFLHRLIIRVGQSSILREDVNRFAPEGAVLHAIQNEEIKCQSLLALILSNLNPNHAEILLRKDKFGRLPLHYAAIYGLDKVCAQIINFIGKVAAERIRSSQILGGF